MIYKISTNPSSANSSNGTVVIATKRTILLGEKVGCYENSDMAAADEFVIKTCTGFLIPSHKESEEICCRSVDNQQDLILISQHALNCGLAVHTIESLITVTANMTVKMVYYVKEMVEKIHYSISDILAWVQMTCQSCKAEVTDSTELFGLSKFYVNSDDRSRVTTAPTTRNNLFKSSIWRERQVLA